MASYSPRRRPSKPYSPPWLPPADLGEGYCSRGIWCSASVVEIQGDGTRKILPAATPRGFCDDCAVLLGTRLDELPEAYARLREELYEPHSRRSKDIRSPLGPAIPLRPDIDALMRLMAVILLAWEARVRSVARMSRPDIGAPWGCQAQIDRSVETIGGERLSILLALQPGWVARSVPLPLGKSGADGLPDDIVEAWGEYELRWRDVDGIRLWAMLDGTAAGLELLDLHYRARSVLGETRAPREELAGVPCKACEAMSLERAEPPSNPEKAAPYSACANCQDTMMEKDYRAWAAWYSGWAKGIERACARCAKGNHHDCEFAACECAAEDHRMLVAA